MKTTPFTTSVPYPRPHVSFPTPNKPPIQPSGFPSDILALVSSERRGGVPGPVVAVGGQGRSDSEIVASGWLMLSLCAASALIGMAMLAAVAMGWN